MRRFLRLGFATTLTVATIGFVVELARPANAELDNHVFTSRADRIRLVVPRGWRESDAPSYPGLLLWMMRPDAKIVLTAEPFTRELYCSWPVSCRTSHDASSMTAKYACALRQKLTNLKLRVGPVQAGPKENAEAGVPSVWFEYDDGKHFMRQAVVLAEDRAISLVLSSPTNEARSSNTRAFETTLRSLHSLSAAELVPGAGSGVPAGSGSPSPAPSTPGSPSAQSASGSASANSAAGSGSKSAPTGSPTANGSAVPIAVDAGVPDATPVTITPAAAAELPAPTPKLNPVGPCTR